MKDLSSNINVIPAFNYAQIATSTTTAGSIIDLAGYQSCTFVINSHTLTDGTYTPLIHDGDNSSLTDAAAVSDDFLIGTEAAAASTVSNKTKRIGYVGNKRYVRLSLVSTSVSSGGYLSATVIKGMPAAAPTAQD